LITALSGHTHNSCHIRSSCHRKDSDGPRTGVLLVETADDLFEIVLASSDLKFGTARTLRVGVVPGVEVIERSQFVSWRVEQFMTREVGVDTVGGRLPWPMAIVAVRSEGTASPPAKTPSLVALIEVETPTTPSSMAMSATCSKRERSLSWPKARTTASAPSSSNSPVGTGILRR